MYIVDMCIYYIKAEEEASLLNHALYTGNMVTFKRLAFFC